MVDPQNINARYIDKFNSGGTTSIKTHNPPGGKSTFSLGWGNDVNENKTTSTNKINKITKNEDLYSYSNTNTEKNTKTFKNLSNNKQSDIFNTNNQEKTSVKVKHAPGGQSSIKFG